MKRLILPLFLLLALPFGIISCSVNDADPDESPALTGISFEADSTQISSKIIHVTGTINLGYTSTQMVDIKIYDNGDPIYARSLSANNLILNISEDVEIIHDNLNALSVEVTYNGEYIKQYLTVNVPSSIQSFSVTPDATQVDHFSVGISGSVEFGFTSQNPAVLEILVNGSSVYSENIDVSSELSHNFGFVIPLLEAADNVVVARISYEGNVLSKQFIVNIPSSIKSFSIAPNASQADRFEVGISGNVEFGFTSQNPAVLEVLVNGNSVYSENIDVSSDLSHAITAQIPLLAAGDNVVVASISYEGNVLSRQFIVNIPSSIQSFSVIPDATRVDHFSVGISGSVEFGFISQNPAVLEILVNGISTYSENIYVNDITSDATALEYSFNTELPLVDQGDNVIVARISYEGNVLSRQFIVNIPSSIQSFSVTPDATAVDHFSVGISGNVEFGFISQNPAVLEVLVNGISTYSENISVTDATSLSYAFNAELPLVDQGDNVVIARISYEGNVLSKQFIVNIPSSVLNFDVTPAISDSNVFSVDVTLDATFGFYSQDSARLNIFVNGQSVYTDTYAVSDATSLSLHDLIPVTLLREGNNDITAEMEYAGNIISRHFSVNMDPSAPSITLPLTWNETFSVNDGMDLDSTVDVDIDENYNLEGVYISVEGDTWIAVNDFDDNGISGGIHSYTFRPLIHNPDIGVSPYIIKVVTSQDSNLFETFAYASFSVHPRFDCADTASMSPSTTLIRDLKYETRDMLGYFGNPDGGHTVEFVIDVTDGNGTQYTIMGENLKYGYTGIETRYNVEPVKAGGLGGVFNYDLTVYVDGQQLCHADNYGVIKDN